MINKAPACQQAGSITAWSGTGVKNKKQSRTTRDQFKMNT